MIAAGIVCCSLKSVQLFSFWVGQSLAESCHLLLCSNTEQPPSCCWGKLKAAGRAPDSHQGGLGMLFVPGYHECSLNHPWHHRGGFSPRSAVPFWLESTQLGYRTKGEEAIIQTITEAFKAIVLLGSWSRVSLFVPCSLTCSLFSLGHANTRVSHVGHPIPLNLHESSRSGLQRLAGISNPPPLISSTKHPSVLERPVGSISQVRAWVWAVGTHHWAAL